MYLCIVSYLEYFHPVYIKAKIETKSLCNENLKFLITDLLKIQLRSGPEKAK